MIWDIDFHQIWREVWTEMQVRHIPPRHHYPMPRHKSRALGKPRALPLPRSWLGGRTTDPHHITHKPHHLT